MKWPIYHMQRWACGLLIGGAMLTAVPIASAWQTVTVQNPDGVRQGRRSALFGEPCILVPETAVFVKHAPQRLGLYRVEGVVPPVDGYCLTGTLFLEVPATVERLQNEAQISRDITANEQRKMRQLLEAK